LVLTLGRFDLVWIDYNRGGQVKAVKFEAHKNSSKNYLLSKFI
jgi:hypothetical protein